MVKEERDNKQQLILNIYDLCGGGCGNNAFTKRNTVCTMWMDLINIVSCIIGAINPQKVDSGNNIGVT